jgi:hypothetical protein
MGIYLPDSQGVCIWLSSVTPDFKTECISYVRQDQVYTHMIDVIGEISIHNIQNVQDLITLLQHHYYTQTVDSKVFNSNK